MTINPFLRRLNGRDNGLAGRKAENTFAERVGGKRQPGSGALDGAKGDVTLDVKGYKFLFENKTTKGESFSLKKDWCLKIYQEALEQNRVPALSFQFVNDIGTSEKRERWVALPESFLAEIFDFPDSKR